MALDNDDTGLEFGEKTSDLKPRLNALDSRRRGNDDSEQKPMRLELQRLQSNNEGQISAPPIVHEVLRSSGQPLDAHTRSFMEPRFGHDFSQVRVHTDAKATESAQAINAQGYTVGQHIVLDNVRAHRTDLTDRPKANDRLSSGSGSARFLMAHELSHVVQQGGALARHGDHRIEPATEGSSHRIQRQSTSPPTSERVWGLPVTRSMCGCRQQVRNGINWANTAAATYAACDIPANPTNVDVEACFDAAHPGTTVAGSTSASGTITLPPPSADPCQRIDDKATFVHETMHARHTNDIARAQGSAFFREWKRLAGVPNRLDTLRATFPAEVAAFEAQWQDGHDWAQDEVNSYRWERRFLQAALAALNRICP